MWRFPSLSAEDLTKGSLTWDFLGQGAEVRDQTEWRAIVPSRCEGAWGVGWQMKAHRDPWARLCSAVCPLCSAVADQWAVCAQSQMERGIWDSRMPSPRGEVLFLGPAQPWEAALRRPRSLL